MREPVFDAAVAAVGCASYPYAAIQPLRKSPPRFGDVTVPGHFLKHVDEQTVVALEAIRRAIERFELDVREQTRWSVISAPRYIGRTAACDIVARFDASGTSGVPTHSAAQYSLNSICGVAGIAMGIRGPTLGVGGGPGSIVEGFTAALTLFDVCESPGVWLTLSGWTREPIPDAGGAVPDDCVCHAVALAIVPGGAGRSQLRLRTGRTGFDVVDHDDVGEDPSVADLAACIEAAGESTPAVWSCGAAGGGTIELRLNSAAEHRRLAA